MPCVITSGEVATATVGHAHRQDREARDARHDRALVHGLVDQPKLGGYDLRGEEHRWHDAATSPRSWHRFLRPLFPANTRQRNGRSSAAR